MNLFYHNKNINCNIMSTDDNLDKMSYDEFFNISKHVFASFDEMKEDLCPSLYKMLCRAYYNNNNNFSYKCNDDIRNVNIKQIYYPQNEEYVIVITIDFE